MKVDVEQILKEKNPAAAKFIPRPLVNYLKRIVHQDEVNEYLALYGHLPPLEFVRACLGRMNIRHHPEGLERLDPAGRYIFASNHPFGGADGLMLADEVSRRFGEARVVVNDILMNLTPLSPIFVPVNKHGRQNPEYARMFSEAFASDMPIITFPAGLCSRRTAGLVTDLPWKPNFIRRAVADRRDVVPVHFDGQLSDRFYRIYSWRKALGVGLNIEMLWLVDEMFRQAGKDFRIAFGEPVPWQSMAGGGRPAAWCGRIREMVYRL